MKVPIESATGGITDGDVQGTQGEQSTQNWTGDPNYAPQPRHVCPNCGFCPCCGRRKYEVAPYPYPYAPYQPWPSPTWISTTTNTLNDGHTYTMSVNQHGIN
jgi:hypothetical protein